MELRQLVKAFRPKKLYPNTDLPGLDMDELFGDLLNGGSTDSNGQVEPPVEQDRVSDEEALSHEGSDSDEDFVPIAEPAIDDGTTLVGEDVPQTRALVQNTPCHKRRMTFPERENAKHRQHYEDAAVGRNGRSWARDVQLMSVSGAYYNEAPEIEL